MTRKSERIARSRRRRLRSLVYGTVASAIAVIIGLSGAGATYAFLSSTVSAPGATVTAGTLTIQINGSNSAALGPFAVSPSVPVAKAFSVQNTGNAPATLDAAISAATTPAITSHTLARVTEVANSAACDRPGWAARHPAWLFQRARWRIPATGRNPLVLSRSLASRSNPRHGERAGLQLHHDRGRHPECELR